MLRSENERHLLMQFFNDYATLSFNQSEVVVSPYVKSPGIVMIIEGYLRIYAISESGKEIGLNIIGPGDFFGFTFGKVGGTEVLFTNRYYYEAFTTVKTKIAPVNDFKEFILQHPEVLLEIARYLARIGNVYSEAFINSIDSAHNKVLSAILRLCTASMAYNEEELINSVRIPIPLTHNDIATLCGLTRENTSIQLKKLAEEGVIRIERPYIFIQNIELLKEKMQQLDMPKFLSN